MAVGTGPIKMAPISHCNPWRRCCTAIQPVQLDRCCTPPRVPRPYLRPRYLVGRIAPARLIPRVSPAPGNFAGWLNVALFDATIAPLEAFDAPSCIQKKIRCPGGARRHPCQPPGRASASDHRPSVRRRRASPPPTLHPCGAPCTISGCAHPPTAASPPPVRCGRTLTPAGHVLRLENLLQLLGAQQSFLSDRLLEDRV